jgi:hypothetical protein
MNWHSWKRLFISLGFGMMTLALCLAVEPPHPLSYSILDYMFIGLLCSVVVIGILRIQAIEYYMQMQEQQNWLSSKKKTEMVFSNKDHPFRGNQWRNS